MPHRAAVSTAHLGSGALQNYGRKIVYLCTILCTLFPLNFFKKSLNLSLEHLLFSFSFLTSITLLLCTVLCLLAQLSSSFSHFSVSYNSDEVSLQTSFLHHCTLLISPILSRLRIDNYSQTCSHLCLLFHCSEPFLSCLCTILLLLLKEFSPFTGVRENPAPASVH